MGEDLGAVHKPAKISTAVDHWYRRHARDLPWRIGPHALDQGARPDPYAVWLSEVMLQQTTVPHAAPYFQAFLARWPTVRVLAAASWEEVSAAWAGLGYYSRARNLHACAAAVAALGDFPQTSQQLRALPGVGPYTAAAIAAIAFGERVVPVDGNIERVTARLFAIGSDRTDAGWRAAKQRIAVLAQSMIDAAPPKVRSGDLAQGLMDLGATVCTPTRPNCGICPLSDLCAAHASNQPERYPEKPLKRDRPVRHGDAFLAFHRAEVFLVRRPPEGLLGGMLMPLSSDWIEAARHASKPAPPFAASWIEIGEARHVFTHFSLRLRVWRAELRSRKPAGEGVWLPVDEALAQLPTIGRKAAALAAASAKSRP